MIRLLSCSVYKTASPQIVSIHAYPSLCAWHASWSSCRRLPLFQSQIPLPWEDECSVTCAIPYSWYWSFHGSWALGDLSMKSHCTIRWNSLIYLINNGHLLYKILYAHRLKLWLSCVDYVSLHPCRTGPSILMIHSFTWECMQLINDLVGSAKPSPMRKIWYQLSNVGLKYYRPIDVK